MKPESAITDNILPHGLWMLLHESSDARHSMGMTGSELKQLREDLGEAIGRKCG